MAASVASYNGSSIFLGTTRGHIFRLNENSLAPIDYSPFLLYLPLHPDALSSARY